MDGQANNSLNQAKQFSSMPVSIGRALLVIALLVLAWSFLLAPDQTARDLSKIVGAAVGLFGLFAYGFGKLVLATNKSPRKE
jgi:predicted permease